jgi:hypothetical protein
MGGLETFCFVLLKACVSLGRMNNINDDFFDDSSAPQIRRQVSLSHIRHYLHKMTSMATSFSEPILDPISQFDRYIRATFKDAIANNDNHWLKSSFQAISANSSGKVSHLVPKDGYPFRDDELKKLVSYACDLLSLNSDSSKILGNETLEFVDMSDEEWKTKKSAFES